MKRFKKQLQSLKGKITLAIILTLLLSAMVMGGLSFTTINQGFDSFLQSQEAEGFGYGRNRAQNDEKRLARYEELIGDFENTVITSILVSTAIGLTLSIVVGLYVSRRVSSPLLDLQNRLKLLTRNKFHKLNKNYSTIEIQNLVDEFNSLIDELQRIEKLREELVSDIAHELKTPLTKILGQLEGCLDGVYECSDDHLKKVICNVYQLETLISTLQKIVEIRSAESKLDIKAINLYQTVDNVMSGFQKEGLLLLNHVPEGTQIEADQVRLNEILDNLVSNSVRHTKAGSITIDYSEDVLSIRDTGEGINSKDLPYIFERFFRVDRSRGKDTGGFGLGLAIVKELVEAHGWKIEASSKQGEGTIFKILLK